MQDETVIEEVKTEVVESTQVEPKQEAVEGEGDKKPNPIRARIDKLTKDRHEAERKALFYQNALEEQTAKAQKVEKPVKADFTDEEAYIEALTDFKVAESAKKQHEGFVKEQSEMSKQSAARSAEQAFAERARSFAEKAPDFDEVMSATTATFANEAVTAIRDSDMGPQLAYYLAKDQKEAERIGALPPLSQVRELGRLEERLSKTPTIATSNAPNPITPTRGTGGKFATDESSMKDREWLAHYKKTYRT